MNNCNQEKWNESGMKKIKPKIIKNHKGVFAVIKVVYKLVRTTFKVYFVLKKTNSSSYELLKKSEQLVSYLIHFLTKKINSHPEQVPISLKRTLFSVMFTHSC